LGMVSSSVLLMSANQVMKGSLALFSGDLFNNKTFVSVHGSPCLASGAKYCCWGVGGSGGLGNLYGEINRRYLVW
jgi:hypothetical protein